ncbi:hypothetical protein F53441_14385 [Fusarium austroafricanum]|uniref:Radical SAM core domain-containing protein n=1 Tax=Fusarium austroafricanum TaxID=2364996 RepID=A0A8H4JDN6_9HYPO|nr:hypothetical protein F53441_14385 [Fusarium austroafricanum]
MKFTTESNVPVSMNYFPSRKCNYSCSFCFHTDTSSYVLPIDEAKRGLRLLKEAGMRKLNIASGEPFLYPRLLTELLQYGKEELALESISIIGRGDDGGNVIRLFRIANWCKEYGIKFKLNTVVNVHNWDEDMAADIESYLLLDEYMCFLDKVKGMITKSESILKVGVQKAMNQVVWDKASFVDRGDVYDWGRSDMLKDSSCTGGNDKSLQW